MEPLKRDNYEGTDSYYLRKGFPRIGGLIGGVGLVVATKLDGIRLTKKEKYAVCHIDSFSSDLEEIVREQLSAICYGPSKASLSRKSYNYKNTLKEFLRRYESKAPTTQIGMIGEMLTHIIIIQFFPEFNTVSPYFNLEERSIKKGFDVVLFCKEENEIWITEVKSGELHKDKNANETNKSLLGTAKSDLNKRLNENEVSFWENAINGAQIALENNRDTKDAVMEILMDIEDGVSEEHSVSKDKNVILVASLFSCLSDEILEEEVEGFSKKTEMSGVFNKTIIFSIQKNTIERVVEFLRGEAQK